MSKLTTKELKANGYICHQVSNHFGAHYAIFRAGSRITAGACTPQTARFAWDDLRSDIETGRIEDPTQVPASDCTID